MWLQVAGIKGTVKEWHNLNRCRTAREGLKQVLKIVDGQELLVVAF
jgi:hypothetical protein